MLSGFLLQAISRMSIRKGGEGGIDARLAPRTVVSTSRMNPCPPTGGCTCLGSPRTPCLARLAGTEATCPRCLHPPRSKASARWDGDEYCVHCTELWGPRRERRGLPCRSLQPACVHACMLSLPPPPPLPTNPRHHRRTRDCLVARRTRSFWLMTPAPWRH